MTMQDRFYVTLDGRQVDARGYIVDDAYINRFFDLQSPGRMLYSLRMAGHDVAQRSDFSYCDLGCGFGLTVLILARCHPEARFTGIDINPDHIAWAQEMAARHGVENVQFICADFADDMQEAGAPFDFITAHGIYTWVAPEVQQAMLGFVGQHLAPDGVFYMSYNAFPGWGAKEALWQIVNRFAGGMQGTSVQRTEQAMAFLQMLSNEEVPVMRDNDAVRGQFDYLKSEDLRYVAHEYCNQNFRPIYASQAFEEAGAHGLHFLSQAESLYALPKWNEPPFLQGMLEEMGRPEERESWISILRNDDFRSDLFARQRPEQCVPEDSALWDMTLALMVPRQNLPHVLPCGPAELEVGAPVVRALLDAAEQPGAPLHALRSHPDCALVPPRVLLETAQLLDLAQVVRFVPPETPGTGLDPDTDWQFADALTPALLEDALATGNLCYLPAPGYGTGLMIEPLLAHAFLAIAEGAEGAGRFFAALKGPAASLIEGPVDLQWCAGFLSETKSRWAPVLGAARVMI